ncbi:Adenylate cyclase [Granulicella sibirica]|uniref:Adenylate cyclase n=1 Tax=Granulicella sibirica TaxID=2479048 RepID=A0A4Q0SW18_9BACT|nr:Adenylate cyclase [Granulicella sibirica]
MALTLRVESHFPHLRNTTVTYSVLLLILFFATRWDRMPAVTASVVGAVMFLYYFEQPRRSFKVRDPEAFVAVISFLITALVVSATELRARQQTEIALERKRQTEQLNELGEAMLVTDNLQATVWIATNRSMPIFGMTGSAFYVPGQMTYRGGESAAITEDLLLATSKSKAVYDNGSSGVSIVPIDMGEDTTGAFGLCGSCLSRTVLNSIGNLLSVVLSRVLVSDKLVVQQRMSESLLLNILPGEVADELRTKGMVSPKYFEDVTILFTDFVGFTVSTESMAAEELVAVLDDYFTAFDQIVTRYRLEKMKTIGDSYMCISGLPVRNPAHPVDMVMAAFEMLRVVEERAKSKHGIEWKIRIGIHTGPVVAGVVGINKFAFDIWGDTVNFSSRMESSGQANRINISERTYSRVKDFFDCSYRGKVLTKEKREYDMYFANGVLTKLIGDSSETPPPAFVRRYHVYFQKAPPSFPEFLIERARPKLIGDGSPAEAS